MNYEEENALLELHGFHLRYDAEDKKERPKDFNPDGEVWQLGSDDNPLKEPECFSRAAALKWIARGRQ